MGARNTPEQQRTYNRTLRERKIAQGLRAITIDLPAPLVAWIDERARANNHSRSAEVARLLESKQ